jgi:hypothetical protein
MVPDPQEVVVAFDGGEQITASASSRSRDRIAGFS